jgi:hypothetical protein
MQHKKRLAEQPEQTYTAPQSSLGTHRLAEMSTPAILYTRDLPGGGYVAIEAREEAGAQYRARLLAERRSDPARRAGHSPPVIAEAEGGNPSRVFDELYAIAADNVAVAQWIMRWQAKRARGKQ